MFKISQFHDSIVISYAPKKQTQILLVPINYWLINSDDSETSPNNGWVTWICGIISPYSPWMHPPDPVRCISTSLQILIHWIKIAYEIAYEFFCKCEQNLFSFLLLIQQYFSSDYEFYGQHLGQAVPS